LIEREGNNISDLKRGLPIRTEEDLDYRVQVKLVDSVNPDTQQQEVTLDRKAAVYTDGIYDAGDNSITPSSTGVIGHTRNAAVNQTMQIERITAARPDSDTVEESTIMAMDVNSFNLGWNPVTGKWERLTSESGSLNVTTEIDGVYSGSNTDPDNCGLIAHTRAVTPTDTEQTLRVTGVNGSVQTTVWALDVALHDEAGNNYTRTNPLPVYLTDESGGDDVHNYYNFAGANVASAATNNHDYTVTAARTLILKQVQGSASSRGKWELQIETAIATNTFDTKGVWFTTESNPAFSETFGEPLEVTTGRIVRLARTNRDNQPMIMYSFINGEEVI